MTEHVVRVVDAYVFRKQKNSVLFLLLKRSSNKIYEHLWQGVAGKIEKDETAWCSAFANWVCKKVGVPYSGKLNARSWLSVGVQVENPRQGDIVVLWRENPNSWKGHVGFYIRQTKNWVYVLGGNQNNAVNIQAYPKKRLLQFRRV